SLTAASSGGGALERAAAVPSVTAFGQNSFRAPPMSADDAAALYSSAMAVRPVRYEFDRFTVDANQRLLFAADTTGPIDLPPRAFDALLYLIERPGELLSKKELLKALWPGVIVEENSLNQVISVVRKVLGEKPSEHRFIVTAPGRGYRFVAAV